MKEEYSQVHKTVEQQIDVLNVQINDFDQRKNEIEVSRSIHPTLNFSDLILQARVEAAVHARVQAQHNVRHYEAKAKETTKVVDAAEIKLKDATEKFEVCLLLSFICHAFSRNADLDSGSFEIR